MVEKYRGHYNKGKPHGLLCYKPPAPETIVAGPNTAVLLMATRGAYE